MCRIEVGQVHPRRTSGLQVQRLEAGETAYVGLVGVEPFRAEPFDRDLPGGEAGRVGCGEPGGRAAEQLEVDVAVRVRGTEHRRRFGERRELRSQGRTTVAGPREPGHPVRAEQPRRVVDGVHQYGGGDLLHGPVIADLPWHEDDALPRRRHPVAPVERVEVEAGPHLLEPRTLHLRGAELEARLPPVGAADDLGPAGPEPLLALLEQPLGCPQLRCAHRPTRRSRPRP